MAALSEAFRESIWQQIVWNNREGEIDSLNRAELRAAIDATDDWVVANAASFNLALPQAARAALTPPQKALMLSYCVRRRWLTSTLAELSDGERENLLSEMVSKNRDAEVSSLAVEALRAAINAADNWIVANAQAFNTALPPIARSVLTTRQKAFLFNLVLRLRWLVNA